MTDRGGAGRAALIWHHRRRWTAPERAPLPIADAAGALTCSLLRQCESVACKLLVYDRTESLARRRCSVAVCDDRAKAAAHRAGGERRLPFYAARAQA